ncbi:MAG: DUF805 domain-containing protein [Firmicutes bacterium]|nr:DUF805 domain-containing protein [Bacillota bacterium]
MWRAYAQFWKRYFQFGGTTSRSEYWLAYLADFLVVLFIGLLFALITILVMPPWDSSAYYPGATEAMMQRVFDVSIFVESAYFILTFIPNISITARHILDAGHTPWWMLIVLLPPAGILIFIFTLQPSKAHPKDWFSPTAIKYFGS